jgi:hypothetical protein
MQAWRVQKASYTVPQECRQRSKHVQLHSAHAQKYKYSNLQRSKSVYRCKLARTYKKQGTTYETSTSIWVLQIHESTNIRIWREQNLCIDTSLACTNNTVHCTTRTAGKGMRRAQAFAFCRYTKIQIFELTQIKILASRCVQATLCMVPQELQAKEHNNQQINANN